MEKKVYLIYKSSRGCKDLVYCTVDKEQAFNVAYKLQAEFEGAKYRFNFRVYEMPLNGC